MFAHIPPMNKPNEHTSARGGRIPEPWTGALSGLIALVSLFVTFVIASSELPFVVKAAAFALVVGINLASFSASLKRLGRMEERGAAIQGCVADLGGLDDKLSALDDANEFFAGALKPADMFRLTSSRMAEIVPLSAAVLFVPDEDSGGWRVELADGRSAEIVTDVSLEPGDGLAAKAAAESAVIVEPEVLSDIGSLPAEFLSGVRSAAALPLAESGSVFAVFQIYSELPIADDDDTLLLLEAAAERLAPLFISSAAFERSIANAFTDPVTNLPNERAFFMVLENQLAESQRYRDERPVTVLAIDIKGFDEANAAFGHAAGDRMLNFATEGIRGQLRKMDFLSRSVNDEFIVILPSAPENTAEEIVERIKTFFANNAFEAADDNNVNIWLHFGTATFWKDGETAQQLLQTAQIRKQQAKEEDSSKILWFPKEYVN